VKRKAIYKQLSKTLESNGVWLWMFTGFDYYALSPKVHNFVPMANESLQYLRQTFLTK
jgi:ABC-type transport system substrate-binding protein